MLRDVIQVLVSFSYDIGNGSGGGGRAIQLGMLKNANIRSDLYSISS